MTTKTVQHTSLACGCGIQDGFYDHVSERMKENSAARIQYSIKKLNGIYGLEKREQKTAPATSFIRSAFTGFNSMDSIILAFLAA